jgi:hypothetical protein
MLMCACYHQAAARAEAALVSERTRRAACEVTVSEQQHQLRDCRLQIEQSQVLVQLFELSTTAYTHSVIGIAAY